VDLQGATPKYLRAAVTAYAQVFIKNSAQNINKSFIQIAVIGGYLKVVPTRMRKLYYAF